MQKRDFDATAFDGNAAIAEALIPSAEKVSGLSRKGLPAPTIYDTETTYEAYLALSLNGALGQFIPASDERNMTGDHMIFFDHNAGSDATESASLLIHELTHWLQEINNAFAFEPATSASQAWANEKPAYAVQAAFLRSYGREPSSFQLAMYEPGIRKRYEVPADEPLW